MIREVEVLTIANNSVAQIGNSIPFSPLSNPPSLSLDNDGKSLAIGILLVMMLEPLEQ